MGTLYGFAYTEAALTSLRKVEPQKVRRQILNKIKTLADDPHPQGIQKLQGASNGIFDVFRLRSGDYRVLYSVRGESEIVVLDIGHRKDIYRNR